MVLVLELVGIGVLGACLSVLLCIIAEGTPREVLKAIGFEKHEQRKPQMPQWTDQQSWEHEAMTMDEKWPRNSVAKNLGPNSEKLSVDFRDSQRKSDGSVRNLYLNNKVTAVKTVDLQSAMDSNGKLCEYCRTLEIPNGKTTIQGSTKMTKVRTKKRRFLLPKSLIIDSRAKNNHIGNHGISDEDFYEGIICRHCYLEALRIKNNKAEQKV